MRENIPLFNVQFRHRTPERGQERFSFAVYIRESLVRLSPVDRQHPTLPG